MVRQGWLQRGRKRGRTRGKRREREAQEVCSCASILNNHVCVRALVHHRRAASVVVVVLSQYKNKPSFLSHCWSNLTPLLTKRAEGTTETVERAPIQIRRAFQQTSHRRSTCGVKWCRLQSQAASLPREAEAWAVLCIESRLKSWGTPPSSQCQWHCPQQTHVPVHEELLTCTTSFHCFSNDVLSSLYISVCCAFLVCTEGVGR